MPGPAPALQDAVSGQPPQAKVAVESRGAHDSAVFAELDTPRTQAEARRPSDSYLGWIIGAVAGGVSLVVIVTVLAVLLTSDEPAPPAPPRPFVQMQGPGIDVKIELPDDFPQAPFGQQPPVIVAPPVIDPGPAPTPPKPAPKPAPEPEDPDPVNRALKKLAMASPFDMESGVRELLKMEPLPERRAVVVKALQQVASTPARFAGRADAVRALARWGTKQDVPFLLTLIDHDDNAVRQVILETLGQWKDARAADPVAQRLVNDADRPWAAKALKDLGAGAEQPVIELLRHPNADVRIEACRVLRVIGTKKSHAALVEAADDPEGRVVQAAREALPAELRPPVYGPNQFLKLNVHVRDPKAWPEIEAKLRKLADSPKAVMKISTSGDYKWVELAPVNTDAETFSRRIRFARIVAVHSQQRLIYIDPIK